jgi:DNA adenine methylase
MPRADLDKSHIAVYSLRNMSERLSEEYISAEQVAQRLGYTVQHTRFLFREGKLPATKLGRDWFAARGAVDDYVARLRVGDGEAGALLPGKNADRQLRSCAAPDPDTTDVDQAIFCAVNVAQVPQRSPFRYPGGKTWLVPQIRRWLSSLDNSDLHLLEPFAGGGIVSLTAVFESLAASATMVELDEDVASVWDTILNGDAAWLIRQIVELELDRHSMSELLANRCRSRTHQALATIVHNRVARGGIMAPGAGVFKQGENGKGLSSRWYPETLQRRILEITKYRSKLRFIHGDGLQVLAGYANDVGTAFFIDPPYTVAGRRLYKHSDIDHETLFDIISSLKGEFLVTYDNSRYISELAQRHGLATRLIAMKTTHHTHKYELLIGSHLDWLDQ